MKITFLPHALEQMRERGITEAEARATLEEPDGEYPADHGRTRAERSFPHRERAVKAVYNTGLGGERVVVSVMLGRPTGRRRGERWW